MQAVDDPSAPNPSPSLHVCLLGQLRLAWGAAALPLPRTAAARSLLAYLILHPGRPLPREPLAGSLWPDRPDAEARKALSNAIWQIRQCLGAAAGRLVLERETISFALQPQDRVDVADFTARLRRCREQQEGGRPPLAELSAAVALYAADLLEDCYDDWVLPERERLHEDYLWALEQLLTLYKQWGDDAQALAYAQRLVAADPLRETAQRELMGLYHAVGRSRAALEQYGLLEKLLTAELGEAPAAATTALYREIQAALQAVGPVHLPAAVPAREGLARLPFVGRAAERAALLEALTAAGRGHGGIVLVEGAAGEGKTRLVEELLADARWRGFQVGVGRADPLAASAPYQPLRDALAPLLTPLRAAQLVELAGPLWVSAAAGVLPVLREHQPELPALDALGPAAERERLWEGLARCAAGLAAVAPLLWILEDVHWADAATLAVLAYIAPRLSGLRLLVVLTCRGAEARERGVVWEALETLDRALPLRRIALAALAPAESAALVQRALGLDPGDAQSQALIAALQRRTGHNALFLVETLKAVLEQRLLAAAGAGALPASALPIPGSLHELVGQRLQHLPAPLRGTLELAAVLGEEASFALLVRGGAAAAAELTGQLGGLCQSGFLREAASGYRFEHELVRDTVYGAIHPRRRQALHRQAVAALEAVQPESLEALAHHAAAGGDRPRAARYNRQAGERAAAQFANREAATYLSRALDFTAAEEAAERYALLLARETAYDLLGEREAQRQDLAALRQAAAARDTLCQAQAALRQANYAEVTADYGTAVVVAQETIALAQAGGDRAAEATGYLRWGCALWRQGQYEAAHTQLERALDLARGAGAERLEAEILRNLSVIAYYRGHYASARPYVEQARRVLRASGDRPGESWALNSLGNLALYQGDYLAAGEFYEQSLRIKREIGDRKGEGGLLNNIGIVSLEQGHLDSARGCLEQSLGICREVGDRQVEANALINLGLLSLIVGDYGGARESLDQAMAISCAISDRQGECWALAYLCLLAHHRGAGEEARGYGERALRVAHELGNRSIRAYVLTNLGHAQAGLGRLEEAGESYAAAMGLRRELGRHNLALESQAGLAWTLLARGRRREAQAQVDEILGHVANCTLHGTEDRFRIYLTCYRVLQEGADRRAGEVLARAYAELQAWAGRLADPRQRRSFLAEVASHREILAAYEAAPVGPVAVRLPGAGAPTGRPLRDDEWVAVTWTPAAPEDEELPDKSRRRRQRLQRLLQEAAAQGAAPTVANLAAALGVDARTIKRDLAALRAAGHAAPTRGRRGPA